MFEADRHGELRYQADEGTACFQTIRLWLAYGYAAAGCRGFAYFKLRPTALPRG